jgi:hypothetical protein
MRSAHPSFSLRLPGDDLENLLQGSEEFVFIRAAGLGQFGWQIKAVLKGPPLTSHIASK